MNLALAPLTRRYLSIYLQDHYAAATAGVALFPRVAASHSDGYVRGELAEIATDVAEDRAALRSVMGSVGVRPARLKALLAGIGEKIGRLKGNGRLLRRSHLSDVVEVEGLVIAVTGKAGLWQSVLQAAEDDRRLDESSLRALLKRAEDQKARLEQLHLLTARSTFS